MYGDIRNSELPVDGNTVVQVTVVFLALFLPHRAKRRAAILVWLGARDIISAHEAMATWAYSEIKDVLLAGKIPHY